MFNHNRILNIFLLSLLIISACKENKHRGMETSDEDSLMLPALSVNDLQPMQNNCASCHKVFPGDGGPEIAPSMGEIRSAYLSVFPDKEDFTKAIVAFSKNPVNEKALMVEAVAKYGLMPKLGANETDLHSIAEYLYRYEVGTDAWQNEWKDFSGTPESEEGLSYEERGRKYAVGTKQALGSKLLAAIIESGPAGAVKFCNIQALPITDSMSTIYGARIKRVSDRPRNTANRANAEELAYIQALRAAKATGLDMDPLISENGDQILAYFAIETNDMCLKCHGIQDQHITRETWDEIARHYPRDLAYGYKINEVRGIFVVEMQK